ncbi:MAG: sialidase family protein, partial [Candidatus Kariarchaeaceae archaeon]
MKRRTLIYRLFAFMILFSFLLSPLQVVNFISTSSSDNSEALSLKDQEFLSSLQNIDPNEFLGQGLSREEASLQGIQEYSERLSLNADTTPEVIGDPKLSEDLNLGNILSDNQDDYRKIWEPWLTKAAVRTMITSPDQQFLLVGGGYLYDNTIKVYRYNPDSDEYEHVWDSGDEIIQSDVVSLAWGDTNHNKFPEVIAGSADGHVYVFEQAHIYDPKTNTENRFEFAWKSPLIQQVWGVVVDDTDLDYIVDIVAGSWDGKIHWYEATDLGDVPVYPFAPDHSIDYREKFTATLPGNERITALASTDTDGDGLPEVIVGTWDGNVFIYENNGTVFIGEGGAKIPLPQTNSYRLDYENYEQFWNPITEISVGNLDGDPQKELAFLVPGQGVFTFDYDFDTDEYFFNKLTKPPESWELGTSAELDVESAGYPVNSYVDWMLTGNNVLSRQNEIDLTDEFREEPFDDAWRDAYPYNTSMAFLPNNSYSYFGLKLDNHTPSLTPDMILLGENSSALVDFGFAQEATGDGRFNDGISLKGYDLLFYMDKNTPVRPNQWLVEISADRQFWSEVYLDETTTASCGSSCIYYIDTDPALNRHKMLEYRYVRMTYFGDGINLQKVDSVYTSTLARPLTEATALTIGTVDFDYVKSLNNDDESDKVIVGSSDGKLFAYEYDESAGKVTQLWTSYNGISDLFTLGTNIWDIVQVQNEGKIPTWRARTDITNMTLPGSSIPGGYVSHTHAHLWGLDLLYDFIPRQNDDLIVTTKTGRTLFYPQSKNVYNQFLTDYYFFAVNQFFQGQGFELAHGFGDSNNDTYPELMVTGAWDPAIIADPSTNTKANAGLYLWISAGVTGGNYPTYLGPIDLVALEQTGMLERALENSRAQPAASFADLDKDGDLDIIFTNGQVYVLWNELAGFVYRLDAEYFSFVNDNTRGRLYTHPIAVDFDDDDDFDLVVSNSQTGKKPKYGGTYWINDGTPLRPNWREDKWLFINSPPPTKDQDPPESNLNFHNYTNFQFVYDPDTGKVANMTSFGYKVNGIVGFQADYINHDHFIVATYPLLKRVEVNLRNSTVVKNWGYRVFETWNTRQELKEWTQSISTGDLDGDGKGEVIVGDYDNNVYVFEHLTSGLNGSVNTYKRAFRSFDLTQNEKLDETPYFAEELPGIAATDFNRTLWHHATFLITGVDLNKNGFQEIVVTAGLSIYIFEKTERVDTYRLMWMTDLRFSKFAKLFDTSSEITALGGGYDMDFNERGEFMVAVGGILMMFEYAGDDNFVELYGGNPVTQSTNLCLSPCLFGRYANVGNEHFATKQREYIWSNLVITSLVVDDVNNNSLQDIVIGGYFEQTWGREDGYLIILEHHLGTITPIYEMELKVLREIPISDILLADQDYDGLKELVIGHRKGVDIWEFDPLATDVSFVKLTHVTSSMNHPIIPLNLVLVGYEGSISDNFDLKIRDHDLLMVRYQHGIWLDPGDMVEVVVMGSFLVLIFSKNDGKTWFPVPGAVYLDSGVQHPTITQMSDGDIVIAYSDIRSTVADIKTTEVEWNVSGTSLYEFQWVNTIRQDGTDLNTFTQPSLYHNPYHSGELSVTYIRENSTNKNIEIQNRNGQNNWGSTSVGVVPNIGNADLNFTYSVSSQDVVYHSATGGFVLAFSGYKYNEFKPDRDIFILYANNDTLVSNFTSRVAFNSVDDLFPSISTLMDEQDFSIIVAFEERGIVPGGRIMVSHSESLGQTWNPLEPLPTQLDNVVNYCFEGLGCYQFLAIPTGGFGTGDQVNQETVYDQDIKAKKVDTNIQKFTYVWIAGIEAFSPAIVGRVDGGFAFTYAMNVLYGDYKLFLQNVLLAFFQGLANGIQAVNLLVQQQNQQQNNNQNQAQLMALYTNEAKKSFVVTHSTVFGRVPVLVSGVNPSSIFAKFSNGETIALAE